jgi:HlyD family secretion protein
VQFPIAQAHAQIEAADLLRQKAAWLFDTGQKCGAEANTAKMLASQAAWAAANACLDAHGGYGFAVDFDVEITLLNPPREIRPDLSATARIVTDTRKNALSIPIIALTVRDHEPVPNESKGGAPAPARRDTLARKKPDREGVFVVRDGIATFRPVKVGIAGDEYFEVSDGVREGETIVAGTYQAIRDLKDGAKVKAAPEAPKGTKKS